MQEPASAWHVYRPYWRAISPIVLLLVIGAVFETVSLVLLVPIATAVATGSDALNRSVLGFTIEGDPGLLVWVAIASALAGLATRMLTLFLQTRLVVAVEREQRARIYRGFLSATWETQSAEPPGRFQWVSNLSQGYANLLQTILSSMKFFINLMTMMVAAVLVSPAGSLAILAVGVVLYVALNPLLRAAKAANRRMQAASKSQNQATAEAVLLASQAKIYGTASQYLSQLMSLTRRVLKERRRARILAQSVPILYQTAALLVALTMLAYATANPVDVPAIGAVALLLFRSLSSAQGIQSALVKYAELRPVLDNLEEWNARYANSPDVSGSHLIDTVDVIELDAVEYQYSDGTRAVEPTTLTLRSGEDLALVGPSGAGKTTLAEILLRLRKPSDGRYRMNGIPAGDVAQTSFVREVAYVPQGATIMRGTVHDNITMLREGIPRARVVEAAKNAGVHEWISRLPDGYDTVIGPDTHGLSGGQAQRMSIARALAGRPSLLVLDEPTSALDVDSEELVVSTLRALPEHVIVVLIAHRMSTLRHCNRILVMEDGRVSAAGTTVEAIEANAFFRRAVAAGALTADRP